MEDKRIELHALLVGILGSENVYFQPPSSILMEYPAIVYSRSAIDNKQANNKIYKQDVKYSITLIDDDPDSQYISEILALPKCKFDRSFSADDLNHTIFTLYY